MICYCYPNDYGVMENLLSILGFTIVNFGLPFLMTLLFFVGTWFLYKGLRELQFKIKHSKLKEQKTIDQKDMYR